MGWMGQWLKVYQPPGLYTQVFICIDVSCASGVPIRATLPDVILEGVV